MYYINYVLYYLHIINISYYINKYKLYNKYKCLYLLKCEVISLILSFLSSDRNYQYKNHHGLQHKIGKMYKMDGEEKIFK